MYVLRSLALSVLIFWVCLVGYSFELNTKVVELTLERPKVTYVNPKYMRLYNFTSMRISRRDHVHYIEFCAEYLVPLDDNWVAHLQVYEFLSNEYRPSFVQGSLKLYSFLQFMKTNVYHYKNVSGTLKEIDMSETLDSGYFKAEPGLYCLKNATLPLSHLPQNFPFQNGRVFINWNYKKKDRVMSSQIDIILKVIPVRKGRG